MTFIARSLLALRPVAAVHHLGARSEACPLSLRDLLRALAPHGRTLPLVAAPIPAVARAALVAAREAGAVVGLALAPGMAPEPWFAAIARAADELAPRLPFFVSGEVRVEGGEAGLERGRAAAHRLVEAGVTHLAVDVSAVALARRAQAAAQVSGPAAEREIAVDCVLPPSEDGLDADDAAAFVEEFEGWGVRADVVSARVPAADGEAARRQVALLDALAAALGGRPLLRRGPLAPGLADRMRASAVRCCEDGGAALAAGLRALPPELRQARAAQPGRGEMMLPQDVSERLEAFAYGEVAALLERLGSAGSAGEAAVALAGRA